MKTAYSPETVKIILDELSEVCRTTVSQIEKLESGIVKGDERDFLVGDLSVSISELRIKASLIEEALEENEWEI